MKKIVIISPKNRTVYNFRGDLIKNMISNGYEVVVTGPNNDNIDSIKDLGARFELIPLDKTAVNPYLDYKYTKNLIKLLKKEKPDLTLGYTIKPVIYGSIAAKKAKIKNINALITGAGYLFTAKTLKAKVLRQFAFWLYKWGLKAASTVIFQNQDDLDEFVKKNLVKKEKCRIVNGSGVNMNKFIKVPYPKQITFFMLSRIMFSKGVNEYLKAAKIIKKKYSDVRFILLGAIENIQDTIPYEDIKVYVENKIVELYGETDNVIEFYKQCSVYVLPSYREGIPRTVLEAMSMGRAIITTDTPGCRETVIDGVTGLKIPVKNVERLVESIEFFIKNPDKIISMGEASHLYCKEKFDVVKINNKMLEYMSIL